MRSALIVLALLAVSGTARAFMLIGGHSAAPTTSCPVKMTGYTHFTGYTLFRC